MLMVVADMEIIQLPRNERNIDQITSLQNDKNKWNMAPKFAPNGLLVPFMLPLNLALLFSISVIDATKTQPSRIALKLIHRSSVFNPSYSRNVADANPIEVEAERSLARLAYLKAKAIGNNSSKPDDVRGPVIAGNDMAEFLVNFSVGNPPVPQLAVMDTGSTLLWFQCLPCIRCSKQSSPQFDPQKSSTYMPLSCDSAYCNRPPPEGKCDPSKHCKFQMSYLDGNDVKGLMATETLTYETSDEGVAQVPDVVIGCGHDYYDPDGEMQRSGVMGLGFGSYSLPTKLGLVFSYCIDSLSDPNYAYNQLILGDGAIIEGLSTPIEIYGGRYYLSMEAISINGEVLKINPAVFRKAGLRGGILIDSGSTFSLMPPLAYNALSSGVDNLINGRFERVHIEKNPALLCYRGDRDRDLAGFPVVRFHFAEGAELAMESRSLFNNYNGVFCMAVMPTNSHIDETGMVGIMAQQGYNVAYDLKAKKIYFQNIDCQLLV